MYIIRHESIIQGPWVHCGLRVALQKEALELGFREWVEEWSEKVFHAKGLA